MGDIFERITNFQLKATKHRVLDIGIERFSSPFFLEPKYLAQIPSNMLKPQEEQVEPPIIFGEWIVKKLQSYAEWQGFVLPDRSNRYRNKKGEICFKKMKKSDKKEKKDKKDKKKEPKKISPKKISKVSKVAQKITKKAVKKATKKLIKKGAKKWLLLTLFWLQKGIFFNKTKKI